MIYRAFLWAFIAAGIFLHAGKDGFGIVLVLYGIFELFWLVITVTTRALND